MTRRVREKQVMPIIYSRKFTFGFWLLLSLLLGCAPLGTRPSAADVKRFAASKHYNADKKQFENRLPGIIEAMNERI